MNAVINYNLDLHGYSYVDELIEIVKQRIIARQGSYYNKVIIEKPKVYTLQLKKIDDKTK